MVQHLVANLDDPGWETTTLDRLETRIRLEIEAVPGLARIVDSPTRRMEALEAEGMVEVVPGTMRTRPRHRRLVMRKMCGSASVQLRMQGL